MRNNRRMPLERIAVSALRLLLLALFALLTMLQFLSFPGKFAYEAQRDPAFAGWQIPLTLIAAFWVLCLQVVVVSTWKLLGMVSRDTIFTADALPWMQRSVSAMATAWAMIIVAWCFVVLNADDPGVGVIATLGLLTFGSATMIAFVLRNLLRRAVELRARVTETAHPTH